MQTALVVKRNLHQKFFMAILEEVGTDLAPHHLMIMKMLQESDELHISEIAKMVAIAKPQMTHSINKLLGLGMVERQANIDDRRRINIRLTPKGREMIERMDEIMKDRLNVMLSTLRDEDLDKLAESFEFIAGTFSKLK